MKNKLQEVGREAHSGVHMLMSSGGSCCQAGGSRGSALLCSVLFTPKHGRERIHTATPGTEERATVASGQAGPDELLERPGKAGAEEREHAHCPPPAAAPRLTLPCRSPLRPALGKGWGGWGGAEDR